MTTSIPPNTIRLAKRLAEQLPCSRQEAEQYIVSGWVTVDNQVTEEPGYRVQPHQSIALLPQASLTAIVPITLLVHKPAGVDVNALIGTINPQTLMANDRSGHRFLKRHIQDLTCTDALETTASGLLIFTQDWHISRKLIDDAAKVEQEHIIEVAGKLTPGGLTLLNHGLAFNGRALPPCKVSWQNETRLRFAVKGVQPSQLTNMCEQVGLSVVTQKRIRIGRIPLSNLPVGQWRYLLGYERF